MKFLGLISSVLLLFIIHLTANQPIPYSGKISIRGVNYDEDAQFTFSLQTKDGKPVGGMETRRMIVLKFVCVMDFTMSY